jgi:hypothetical protein
MSELQVRRGYSDVCCHAMEEAAAVVDNGDGPRAVVLVVLGGKRGDGYSVRHNSAALAHLPALLECLAKRIRRKARLEGYHD